MNDESKQERPFKVVLFTFPPVKHAYSISPFAVKVESYLRINDIPFEMVYTSQFGPKGKIPYIHIIHHKTGKGDDEVEIVPDSNVILSRLEDLISPSSKDAIANLRPEEKAIGHAVTRMIEEHTAQIGFYYRYTLATKEFMEVLDVKNYMFEADKSCKGAFIGNMFEKFIPMGITKKMNSRGLTGHSNEELWKFSNDDLLAISNYLGGKKFFFGREYATAIDCTIFGHLSQFLYIPIDFPQAQFLKEHCPNLINLMERFKARHWPDWEEKCERQPNQNLLT